MDLNNYELMTIQNVSLSNMGFVVFLKRNINDHVLPIFIGASEAHSISAALNGQKLPRPLSHDLFKNILGELDCNLQTVFITQLQEDTYYAQIQLIKDNEKLMIDARPSDAIALALRYSAPIYSHHNILDKAAVALPDEETKPIEDKKLKSQLDVYKEAMAKAIDSERYEDAANLRDQIKNIQKNN